MAIECIAESYSTCTNSYHLQMGYKSADRQDVLSLTGAGKANIATNVMLVALAVIVTLSFVTPGLIPSNMVGWIATGLGGGAGLAYLCGGNIIGRWQDVSTNLAFSAAVIVAGALGGVGILSTTQMHYLIITIIGTQVIRTGLQRMGHACLDIPTYTRT